MIAFGDGCLIAFQLMIVRYPNPITIFGGLDVIIYNTKTLFVKKDNLSNCTFYTESIPKQYACMGYIKIISIHLSLFLLRKTEHMIELGCNT